MLSEFIASLSWCGPPRAQARGHLCDSGSWNRCLQSHVSANGTLRHSSRGFRPPLPDTPIRLHRPSFRRSGEGRLSGDWSSAEVRDVLPTPADRTFTTAKIARGQLLAVDSKFGFPLAAAVGDDRVVPIDLF
jgi:hypothetical protein